MNKMADVIYVDEAEKMYEEIGCATVIENGDVSFVVIEERERR